jgi:hypothetical protein
MCLILMFIAILLITVLSKDGTGYTSTHVMPPRAQISPARKNGLLLLGLF